MQKPGSTMSPELMHYVRTCIQRRWWRKAIQVPGSCLRYGLSATVPQVVLTRGVRDLDGRLDG